MLDEEAVGGCWIAIAGQVLNIEPGSGGSAFKVADYNTLGGDIAR